VYSNTTAACIPGEPDAIRARLAEHIGKPVHFVQEVEAMYADGARVFVEAGPAGC
jgi:acyl transferase domain-containing protein